MSDPVWAQFLDEARAHGAALAAASALAALSTTEQHRLVGAMFALRTSASLLGVEAVTRAATAAEIAVAERSSETWADLRPALAACARALTGAIDVLASPDASGARIEDTEA